MSDAVGIKDVYDEVRALRKDVEYIKESMADMFMTPEEEKRFDKSMRELNVGKTTSLPSLKKQLRL